MSEPIISVSGLRGVIGESLTPDLVVRYVAAFAATLPPGPVVVSRDGRTTGLMLAAAACYDPHEAIPLWNRMSEIGGGARPPEFASTHPDPANRIAHLQALMPRAEQYYAKYCGGKPASK